MMVKSVFILYFVLCWCILGCLCDDPPAPGSPEAEEAALKEKGIDCNNVSNAVTEDSKFLQTHTLNKTATVKLEKDFYIVTYKSASAVSRASTKYPTTMTYAHLKEGIDAIMNNCKPDDGKISGTYTFIKNPKDVYKVCLTGSEETDDC